MWEIIFGSTPKCDLARYNCYMTYSLLVTKLFIPHARPKLVSRPRLVDRINKGLHRKLTLISAPAGFGKTTLVMEWLMGVGEHSSSNWIGWFSIDETDNDPIRFFYVFLCCIEQSLWIGAETFVMMS